MKSPVVLKIISLECSFTSSEYEISQFVINNPDYVIANSISELANKINTSEASINRFCRKVGFKGFNKFKMALAQSNTQLDRMSENEVDADNLLDYITYDYQQMILSTCALLEKEDVEEVASLIPLASKVFMYPIYTTSFVVGEFSFKLRQLGIDVIELKDHLEAQLAIEYMNSDSLLITVVPSVTSKGVLPFLDKIRTKNVKTVLISENDNPKLSDLIDVKILIPGSMTAKNPLVISNSPMISLVFDIIYATILKNNKAFRQRKLSSDTIIDSFEAAESARYEW